MKKLIVYCHGYNSSAKTDKVDRLKDAGFEVLAWDISINPTESLPKLVANVYGYLLDNLNAELDLVFVGTSLGGWYANMLGYVFGAKTVMINPALDPGKSLKKFNVSDDILSRYNPAILSKKDTVFIARDDDVIDFSSVDFGPSKLIVRDDGGHRFNGAAFDDVIEYLKA